MGVEKPRRDDVIERAVYEGKVLKLLQTVFPRLCRIGAFILPN
ncbi:hypothetical protein PO124_12390 [Bacillus licheniformis]|nr:hypothetical protein [Bacillus licheniformis]